MKCCICNEEIDVQYAPDGTVAWDKGHNAEPVREGRCCSTCNTGVVLPVRMMERLQHVIPKSKGVVDK